MTGKLGALPSRRVLVFGHEQGVLRSSFSANHFCITCEPASDAGRAAGLPTDSRAEQQKNADFPTDGRAELRMDAAGKFAPITDQRRSTQVGVRCIPGLKTHSFLRSGGRHMGASLPFIERRLWNGVGACPLHLRPRQNVRAIFIQMKACYRIRVDFGLAFTDTYYKWTGNIRSANRLRRISGPFAFMGSFQDLPRLSRHCCSSEIWPPRRRRHDSLDRDSVASDRSGEPPDRQAVTHKN